MIVRPWHYITVKSNYWVQKLKNSHHERIFQTVQSWVRYVNPWSWTATFLSFQTKSRTVPMTPIQAFALTSPPSRLGKVSRRLNWGCTEPPPSGIPHNPEKDWRCMKFEGQLHAARRPSRVCWIPAWWTRHVLHGRPLTCFRLWLHGWPCHTGTMDCRCAWRQKMANRAGHTG